MVSVGRSREPGYLLAMRVYGAGVAGRSIHKRVKQAGLPGAGTGGCCLGREEGRVAGAGREPEKKRPFVFMQSRRVQYAKLKSECFWPLIILGLCFFFS